MQSSRKCHLIFENLTGTRLTTKNSIWASCQCLVSGCLAVLTAHHVVYGITWKQSSFLYHLHRCSSSLQKHLGFMFINLRTTYLKEVEQHSWNKGKLRHWKMCEFVFSCQMHSTRAWNESPGPNNPALNISPSFHPNIPRRPILELVSSLALLVYLNPWFALRPPCFWINPWSSSVSANWSLKKGGGIKKE